MTPADKLAAAAARGLFAREVSGRGEAISLGRAALLVGAEEEPRACDLARQLALLDEMGAQARARLAGAAGGAPAVESFNRYMFGELGFGGDRENYYDPRNSMLHRVIERRAGIPITLSVVYMEVARRAGLLVRGVGLPGHFIVRVLGESGRQVLVDPFYGQVVDREDCQRRLDVTYGGQVALTDGHLRAVGAREILARLLGNLKAVYVQARLFRRALAASERIVLLNPRAAAERRDRGVLLAQLDRLPEAVADLGAYLRLSPGAPDAESVREQLKNLQTRQAMRN